ncbi:MAG: tyrosine-type recombinase/integrase [Muribaculaceae bacterium]|nr:tyrosine-type recombinase/integrase [Muribaculaceae bacterium]
MSDLYGDFLNHLRYELNMSVHTARAYGNDLRQWHTYSCANFGDGFNPAAADITDLRLWVASLASEGVGARSIRRKVQTLRAFFRYLQRRGLVAGNPAADLVTARMPKTLPSVVKPDEMKEILDAPFDAENFAEVRNRLIINILYSTGMRASELVGLTLRDIDMRGRELKVLGKRNKERIIPFGQELYELLALYIPMRPSDLCDSLLLRESGKPFTYADLRKVVHDELRGNTTARKQSPHVLRHSFATDMLNCDAEITAVQQLLGHASLATTQLYTHLSYKELLTNYEHAHPRAQKQ